MAARSLAAAAHPITTAATRSATVPATSVLTWARGRRRRLVRGLQAVVQRRRRGGGDVAVSLVSLPRVPLVPSPTAGPTVAVAVDATVAATLTAAATLAARAAAARAVQPRACVGMGPPRTASTALRGGLRAGDALAVAMARWYSRLGRLSS